MPESSLTPIPIPEEILSVLEKSDWKWGIVLVRKHGEGYEYAWSAPRGVGHSDFLKVVTTAIAGYIGKWKVRGWLKN